MNTPHAHERSSMNRSGIQVSMARAIEMWPIDRLVPYERNPRTHSPEQVTKIAASIEQFGFNNPLLVDSQDGIIAGHGRLLAARQLGLGEVPVIVLDHLTDAQRRAYVIADNKLAELAGWDDDLLALELATLDGEDFPMDVIGFTDQELAALLDVDQDEEANDAVPEAPAEPITNRGDVWLLGRHRLLCGDSTKADDVARAMGGKKADCVFTSPPYAVGIDYGETYKDTLENLRTMLGAVSVLWHEVILPGGYAVTNFGDILSGREIAGSDEPCEYPMALEYFPIFRAAKWTLWARRVWCKPGAACGSSRHCIGTNRAASNYEHVWTWKRAGKSIVDDQLTGEWPSQAGWFDTTHENKLGVGLKTHGAGMPPAVAARAVFWHSRPGSIVHEPFCGTGTTIIACEQLGRKCYGMEISPAYCDVIVRRWEQYTGLQATLEDGGATFSEIAEQRGGGEQ